MAVPLYGPPEARLLFLNKLYPLRAYILPVFESINLIPEKKIDIKFGISEICMEVCNMSVQWPCIIKETKTESKWM